jgi:hypothetical protein
MRTLVLCLLAALFACAPGTSAVDGEGERTATVVITLDGAVGAHTWPTARAELGAQGVAFCPVRISTPQGSDELHCDYLVGPLWVPGEYRITVRGDAEKATVERTPDAIRVQAAWGDTSVAYRVDLRQGEPMIDPGTAAGTLRIVCDGLRTTVLTPVVRTAPDGLRVSVEAPDDVWGIEFHHLAWQHGTAIGGPVGGASTPLEPGAAVVACLPGPRSSYWDVAFGTFHLVDPDGLWITSGVDCAETSSTEGRRRLPGDLSPSPELVARLEEALEGLESDDLLRPDGYPALHGAKLNLWEGIIVRDGSRIAVVNVDWDGRVSLDACVGSGISLRR